VFNGAGDLVDQWPHLDKLFAQLPCGRGPHQIKISPYDKEKHVWIIDDQLHVIYRFTYDGKLVHTLGELGKRGRGPNTFDRPTDIAWLPDGTYFITDGYGGTRVAKFDAKDNFIMDWGKAPADPANPGPNEFNTVHSIAISTDRRLFVVDRGVLREVARIAAAHPLPEDVRVAALLPGVDEGAAVRGQAGMHLAPFQVGERLVRALERLLAAQPAARAAQEQEADDQEERRDRRRLPA